MAEFHHGITGREATSGKIPIRNAATAVMAMLAFADDADDKTFPLNTPVLVTSINRVLPKAGTTGNLRKNLEIIAQITSPTLVVIRVENPFIDGFDQSKVIGTTESGMRTGLQALLTVKSILGITPKIICVSDVETIDVANAIGAICKKLRAYSYITPRNSDGVILESAEAVVNFRNMLAFREIELIWPEWISGNVFLGESSIAPSFPAIPEENIRSYITFDGWFGLTWLSDIEWHMEVDGVVYKQTTPFGTPNFKTMDGSISQIISDNNLDFLSSWEGSSGDVNLILNEVGAKYIRLIPQSLLTNHPNNYPKFSNGSVPVIDPLTKIWSFILRSTVVLGNT